MIAETASSARRESVAARAAELPHGVRDTRAAMRRIAEAYRQQESAGAGNVHSSTGNVHSSAGNVRAATVAATAQAQAERREVNPTVHAILSFVFPGVGQMLNGQSGKGIFLIAAGIALSVLSPPFFPVVSIVARVLVAVDAYRIGERRRKGEKIEPGEWDFS